MVSYWSGDVGVYSVLLHRYEVLRQRMREEVRQAPQKWYRRLENIKSSFEVFDTFLPDCWKLEPRYFLSLTSSSQKFATKELEELKICLIFGPSILIYLIFCLVYALIRSSLSFGKNCNPNLLAWILKYPILDKGEFPSRWMKNRRVSIDCLSTEE